jgi:fumarylacetoacetase
MIDQTHAADLQSWVESANGHRDFPIQNLPLGMFIPPGGHAARGGVAIGDSILDLGAALEEGLLSGEARTAAEAAAGPTLNPLMALGVAPRRTLRRALSAMLGRDDPAAVRAEAAAARLLHKGSACVMAPPAEIGDYTDFYAGINHAVNVGRLFRPDNPLLPNYKHVPIGYHGRASTVRLSGAPVLRPNGQVKAADADTPTFGPSRRLDIELELGLWIGPGNAPGQAVSIKKADAHIAGYCLLNDWSARDIQAWEYQPLGPFLAKNFLTTISPWVITPEAMAPFRTAQEARPEGDPRPLPYLWDEGDQAHGALDLQLKVMLTSSMMRSKAMAPVRISLSNTRYLYWTFAQMLAHHASNGCELRPGDLFGSGTISGPTPDSLGSLLEMSEGGRRPIALPSGETRTFLEDGDEIVLAARAEKAGFASIGFGECRGRIRPSDWTRTPAPQGAPVVHLGDR